MLYFTFTILDIAQHYMCIVCGTCIIHIRAVRYHPKYAYHDTIALVSRYTLGIDTYMTWLIMTYRIRGNFRGMYISRLANQSGFSRFKFHGSSRMKLVFIYKYAKLSIFTD